MNRLLTPITALILLSISGAAHSAAQTMDDLNLQVHGYATQGFLYSTANNWNTTASTDGSAAWTEAVVNLAAQPQPKLHIGVQARYYLLGNYGNQITLDWAEADYKVNEKLGFRAGKVKTPAGMLNETQDIDPSMLWVLLPQSAYPIADRNGSLAHYGGVVYGAMPLGESFGKVEYRGFAGQRVLGADDATFQFVRDLGSSLPNGATGPTYGGMLRWETPVRGLMAGASENSGGMHGATLVVGMPGSFTMSQFRQTSYFTKYERDRIMLAGEYTRVLMQFNLEVPSIFSVSAPLDERLFYGMASYKFRDKLTAGLYYSSAMMPSLPQNNGRYQKDWALAARYDFNPFLYLKAEQHWIDGTAIGYSTSNNTGGFQPNSRMTLVKLGVSF